MSRPLASTADAPRQIAPRMRVFATLGAVLALALASVDVSIVSAAMPRIAEDLNGLSLYAWVGIAYAVAAAVVVPIAGKLGDMFGRKPFLLVGLVGFLVTSFLCGASQTMMQLIIFRGLQGLFGGILMANVFTLVADIYPAEKRPQIQGILFSVAGLSMVIGPPAGGLLTDNLSWRWVFYINIPIGLLAILAVVAAVPYIRSGASLRDIDFLGAVTLVAGLVPILIGLSLTGDGHAWSSAEVWSMLVTGAILLTAFFLVEVRLARNPIVPVEMFRINQVAVMAAVAFFSAFAMMGAIFFVPLLYQGVLGVSATSSGNLLIPLTLALMVVPPFAGKAMTMVTRYRVLAVVAFACMAGGLLLLTQINPGSSRWLAVAATLLIGVGLGIVFPMATSVVQNAIPMSQMGAGTSQIQFWRMIAGPVSLAILGSVLAARTGSADQLNGGAGGNNVSPEALASALHQTFLVAAVIVAIGLVASLFLREVPIKSMPGMGRRSAKKQPVSAGR
jgi:EmrB/QacA subfamily drug resistance transporter